MTCSPKHVAAALLAATILPVALHQVDNDEPDHVPVVGVDYQPCCSRNCREPLFPGLHRMFNGGNRSGRNWKTTPKRKKRTQPIEIEQQSCPNGQCQRADGGCKNGQCTNPSIQGDGFRLQRSTPRRSLEINVPPAEGPGASESGAPDDLTIQVQDIEPIPRDGGPEPDLAEPEVVETEQGDVNASTWLAAVAGVLVAAFNAYVRG